MGRELRSLNSIQSLILENSIMGICLLRNRIFQWVNPRVCELFGLPLERIQGASTRLIYPSDESFENEGRKIYPALSKGEWFELELAVQRPNGQTFICRIVGKALNPNFPQDGSVWIFDDITDRKRAEDSLRESEEKYRTVVEKATEGIMIAQDDRFIYANPMITDHITGMPIEEMVGKSFIEFIHPEDRKMVLSRYRRRQAGEEIPDNYEFRIIGKDGRLTWVRLSAKQIQWNGRPATINIFTDVTERRKAETALKESENWYRAIFENTGAATAILDKNTTIILANAEFEKMSGYPKSELEGKKSWTDFVIPEDLGRMLASNNQRRIDQTSALKNYEFRGRDRNGQLKNILLTVDVIPGTERIVASLLDVTEQKKAAEALWQNEERYRTILDEVEEGYQETDLAGNFTFFNEACLRIYGSSRDELMGTKFNEYVSEEEVAKKVYLAYNQVYKTGVPLKNLNFDITRKDGTQKTFEFYVSLLKDSNDRPKGFRSIVRDVTERKWAEKEREKLRAQLTQAQKMEAIGTLAGGIAHDFNNMLASMMGYTEMAAGETREDVRKGYLAQVLQACERAKNLVNQILAFSRKREQERRPVDIRPIIKEALTLLRATLPSTIEIKQDISNEPAVVLADTTRIHQILMNLCTNAAHAMSGQGVISVGLTTVEVSQAMLALLPDLNPGSYILLQVQDTGHGIDPAVIDKIFDPFFTTKKAGGGTGLGLSVVYGITKAYGGAIDVQSSPRKGTIFNIYLPGILSVNQGEESPVEEMNLQGSERILFVDDEEMLVKMAEAFFQSVGYRITATTSSREALRLFQENPRDFDLMITDMTMPHITGLELSRTLLEVRPDLPVILCTGYSDTVNIEETKKLHIREFVMKPVKLNNLGLMVRRILDNEVKN